jgi:hypothetical protein
MTVVTLDMAYRLYGAFVVKRCFAPLSYLIRNDHAAQDWEQESFAAAHS